MLPRRLPVVWVFSAVKGFQTPRVRTLGLIVQPSVLPWHTPLRLPEPAAPWALAQTIIYLLQTQRLVTTVLIEPRLTIEASCQRTSGKIYKISLGVVYKIRLPNFNFVHIFMNTLKIHFLIRVNDFVLFFLRGVQDPPYIFFWPQNKNWMKFQTRPCQLKIESTTQIVLKITMKSSFVLFVAGTTKNMYGGPCMLRSQSYVLCLYLEEGSESTKHLSTQFMNDSFMNILLERCDLEKPFESQL